MAALSNIVRVTAQAAVAGAEVEVTVRPEKQSAAVMVPVRVGDLHQDAFSAEISFVRIGRGDPQFAEHFAFGALLSVIKVEQTIGLELRMKSEGEQALLVLHLRLSVANIQKRRHLVGLAVSGHRENFAALFNHEQAFGPIRGFFHPERANELRCRESDLQFERWQRLRRNGLRAQAD